MRLACVAMQVLPRVMEQVISCKDDIAQQYLFQVWLQITRAFLS